MKFLTEIFLPFIVLKSRNISFSFEFHIFFTLETLRLGTNESTILPAEFGFCRTELIQFEEQSFKKSKNDDSQSTESLC